MGAKEAEVRRRSENVHVGRRSVSGRSPFGVLRLSVSVVGAVLSLLGSARAAGDYPLTLMVDAKASTETSTVTSVVTIRVDRLMDESRRKKVSDALKFGGYGDFVPALRALPAIGTIQVEKRSVEIRYAHEQTQDSGRRLVLVADRPLFFLGANAAKSRAGYELTLVELRFDAKGGATGTLAGAARVKTSPDGPVVDDWAEAPVTIASRAARP
jgi:hypothetical protein